MIMCSVMIIWPFFKFFDSTHKWSLLSLKHSVNTIAIKHSSPHKSHIANRSFHGNILYGMKIPKSSTEHAHTHTCVNIMRKTFTNLNIFFYCSAKLKWWREKRNGRNKNINPMKAFYSGIERANATCCWISTRKKNERDEEHLFMYIYLCMQHFESCSLVHGFWSHFSLFKITSKHKSPTFTEHIFRLCDNILLATYTMRHHYCCCCRHHQHRSFRSISYIYYMNTNA